MPAVLPNPLLAPLLSGWGVINARLQGSEQPEPGKYLEVSEGRDRITSSP